jgi:arylsulfatase A-like enzyme
MEMATPTFSLLTNHLLMKDVYQHWKYGVHLLAMLVMAATPSLAQSPPNVIVFIADDAGMDLGCYGYEGATTPNLDALAAEGLRFTQAFLTSPQCSPSRTSLLSGQFAHQIGTEDLHTGIDSATTLLPSYLREAGYYAGMMLKAHIGTHGTNQFDWYDEGFWPDYARDGVWHQKAVRNLDTFLDQAGEQPFFLWVGFVEPHRPYRETPLNRARRVNDPATVRVPPFLVDDDSTRQDLVEYYDEITRMDSLIGAMMQRLEARNLRENTVILFLSDNGMPFPRGKGTLYDSGIQTPLLISWPGHVPAGETYDSLTSLIDLAPTLIDLAGLPPVDSLYGRSWRPLFDDLRTPGRDYIFAERNWHNCDEHMRAIRSDRFLMVMNSYIALPHGSPNDVSSSPSWFSLKEAEHLNPAQTWLFQAPRPALELYDVQADPYQLHNLTGQAAYLDTAQVMVHQLIQWMQHSGDHQPHLRRRHDDTDRVSGYPLTGAPNDRAFWQGYWDE